MKSPWVVKYELMGNRNDNFECSLTFKSISAIPSDFVQPADVTVA